METKRFVSIRQMKDVLVKEVGTKIPVKISRKDGQVMVCYFRGFADQQTSILLVSENSYSLAMKILELKDICRLEYVPENAEGPPIVLHANWLAKQSK